MAETGRGKLPNGCLEPSGLYRKQHFLIALDHEILRLDSAHESLTFILVDFVYPPDWDWLGPKLLSYLGARDLAGRIEERVAILLPEASFQKVRRVLEQMAELGPMTCGLVQARPGHLVTDMTFFDAARCHMIDREDAIKELIASRGPLAEKETEVLLEEKNSLFEGFSRLSAKF
ncbi:MAG: hypothetical protein LBT38_11880 [Deltaproteobacteria bacterium]|jgi:hypothetical protein|nr:hypothetical protein [Deltaproteobacteria bacterium]